MYSEQGLQSAARQSNRQTDRQTSDTFRFCYIFENSAFLILIMSVTTKRIFSTSSLLRFRCRLFLSSIDFLRTMTKTSFKFMKPLESKSQDSPTVPWLLDACSHHTAIMIKSTVSRSKLSTFCVSFSVFPRMDGHDDERNHGELLVRYLCKWIPRFAFKFQINIYSSHRMRMLQIESIEN